jgi:hypothetical protein
MLQIWGLSERIQAKCYMKWRKELQLCPTHGFTVISSMGHTSRLNTIFVFWCGLLVGHVCVPCAPGCKTLNKRWSSGSSVKLQTGEIFELFGTKGIRKKNFYSLLPFHFYLLLFFCVPDSPSLYSNPLHHPSFTSQFSLAVSSRLLVFLLLFFLSHPYVRVSNTFPLLPAATLSALTPSPLNFLLLLLQKLPLSFSYSVSSSFSFLFCPYF